MARLLNQNNIEIQAARVQPEGLASMLKMIDEGKISGKIAKKVFEEMFMTGKNPEQIVEEKGLVQISDPEVLQPMMAEIVASHPKVVEDYRSGKDKAFGFFVGQVMKKTRGKANPAIVNQLLREHLDREG